MENSTTSNSIGEGNTHVWVSARHGDLSEWAPYSGLELSIPVLPPIASPILIKHFVTVLHKNIQASNNVPQFLIEWSSSYIFVLLAGFSSEEDAFGPKHRKRTYMNQPHLRFEITSDDGFSVKASSIEGENSDLGFVDSKAVFGYAEEGEKKGRV